MLVRRLAQRCGGVGVARWASSIQIVSGGQPALAAGRVAGMTALVTGGGQGLGEAFCRALASEGASVVVADVNAERARTVAASIPGGMSAQFDVTKSEEVASLVEQTTISCGGRLDIVINNAGIVVQKPTHELPLDDWHKVINVNLHGAFYVLQAALQQMMKQEPHGGVVLNILSTAAHTGVPNIAPYTAAKAAMGGLTKSTATEYAPYGIRVVGLSPTGTNTEMVRNLVETVPGFKEAVASSSPLHSKLEPHGIPETWDIAQAALFLCSPEARWISGSVLKVDGALLASSVHPAP